MRMEPKALTRVGAFYNMERYQEGMRRTRIIKTVAQDKMHVNDTIVAVIITRRVWSGSFDRAGVTGVSFISASWGINSSLLISIRS
jgi:hypothetical protein